MHDVTGAAYVKLLSKLEFARANSNKNAVDIAETAIREKIEELKRTAHGAADHHKGAALELANKLTDCLDAIKLGRNYTGTSATPSPRR